LTDNKALAHLLSNPISKMPARIERLSLKLQGYRFRITHIKDTDNLSDYCNILYMKHTIEYVYSFNGVLCVSESTTGLRLTV
jgi:hypothetical protein